MMSFTDVKRSLDDLIKGRVGDFVTRFATKAEGTVLHSLSVMQNNYQTGYIEEILRNCLVIRDKIDTAITALQAIYDKVKDGQSGATNSSSSLQNVDSLIREKYDNISLGISNLVPDSLNKQRHEELMNKLADIQEQLDELKCKQTPAELKKGIDDLIVQFKATNAGADKKIAIMAPNVYPDIFCTKEARAANRKGKNVAETS